MFVIGGLLLAACATGSDRARVAQAQAYVTANEGQVDDVEATATRLSSVWNRVRAGYDRARDDFHQADGQYREAAEQAAVAGQTFQAAARQWEEAGWRWHLYQQLVQVAAAMDAANLERARRLGIDSSDLSCKPTSTAVYRRMLGAQGVDLTGKDIDHIVPHSKGGPDNIANYEVLPSSQNRSIGDLWGPEKCKIAGADKCALAIAVTTKCNPSFAEWLP